MSVFSKFSKLFSTIATAALVLSALTIPQAATAAPSAIAGNLTDSITAEPIAGASLELCNQDTSNCETASTNGSGDFSFANESTGNYSLAYSATGYFGYTHPFTFDENASDVFDAILLPFQDNTLAVTVTNASSGTSVTNATVQFITYDLYPDLFTLDPSSSADGVYQFDQVPALPNMINVSAPGYVENDISYETVAGSNEVTISLTPELVASASLSATVLDDQGQPIENAQVSMQPVFAGGDYQWGMTDASGVFNQPALIPGRYVANIYADGFYNKHTSVIVVDGDNTPSFSLTPRSSNTLSGQVTEAVSGDGQEAQVQYCGYADGTQVCDVTTTASDGNYSFSEVPSGPISIRVWPSGNSRFFYTALDTSVSAGQNTFDVKVKGYPIGTLTISGVARDTASHTLANAQIYAYADGGAMYRTTSASNGSYSLTSLPAGTYSVYSWREGYIAGSAKRIKLTSTSVTQDLTFSLPGSGTLSGHIYDSAGSPVEGASVSVCSSGEFRTCAWASSDVDGFYSAGSLLAGALNVNVTASMFRPKSVTISSFNGVSKTQDITIQDYASGTGVITGTVTNASGQALSGARVDIYASMANGSMSQNYEVFTDNLGHYRKSDLPAGDFSVYITGPNYPIDTTCSEYFTLKNTTKTLNCKIFQSTASLTVHAEDSNGNALAFGTDISITNMQAEFKDGQNANSSYWVPNPTDVNSDGSITFNDVPNSPTLSLWINQFTGSNFYIADKNYSLQADASGGDADVTLVLDTVAAGENEIHGQVKLKSDSTALVPNTQIEWYSNFQQDGKWFVKTGMLTTDENGNYSVTGLKAGSKFSMNASIDMASGGVYGSVPVQVSSREINIYIDDVNSYQPGYFDNGAGSYSATLVDENNQPIPDAYVNICAPDGSCTGNGTDQEGQISVSNLQNGRYQIMVDPTGSTMGLVSPTWIEITDQVNTLADQVLVARVAPTGSSTITGQLYDTRVSAGFSNFTCSATLSRSDLIEPGTSYTFNSDCVVDENGNFQVTNLIAGWYSISFSGSENLNGVQVEVPSFQYVQVDGTESLELPRLNVSTSPVDTSSVMDLKVLDKKTRLPLDKNTACYSTSNFVFGSRDADRNVALSATGHAIFRNLLPGSEYGVSCTNFSTAAVNPYSNYKFVATAGAQTGTLYVDAMTADGSYSGVITDDQDQPLAGVRVGFGISWPGTNGCRCGDGFEAGDTTDSTGHFYIDNVPVGTLTLNISDDFGKRFTPVSESVVTEHGQHIYNRQVHMGALVDGTIVDATGLAASEMQIILIDKESGKTVAWNDQLQNGKFTFNQMVPLGDYLVWAQSWSNTYSSRMGYLQSDGSLSFAKSSAYTLTVSDYAPTVTHAPTIHSGASGSISGNVQILDSNSNPVTNRWIYGEIDVWFLDNGQWVKNNYYQGWFSSGSGGDYRIDALPPGTYKLEFKSYAQGEKFTNSFATLSNSTSLSVTAGHDLAHVNGRVQFAKPTDVVQAVSVDSLSANQIDALTGTWSVAQSGSAVTLTAPEDLQGKWVAITYATPSVTTAGLFGRATASTPTTTDWLQVDASGHLVLPAGVSASGASTLVLTDGAQVPVGIAQLNLVTSSKPSASSKPSVSGKAKAGSKLTGNKGTWAGSPAPTFKYQWYVCGKKPSAAASLKSAWKCAKIKSATKSTYKTAKSQIGKYIMFGVTAKNSIGSATWYAKSVKVSK